MPTHTPRDHPAQPAQMDSCSGKPSTEAVDQEEARCVLPVLQVSFHLAPEEESSQLTAQEMREAVRDYGQTILRVDTSLLTLKNQLMAMREQDLQLLKQLIQVGDTIRRLTRCRRGSGRRSSHGSTQELMTSAADLSVTLRRLKGGRSSSVFAAGDYSTVPLLRRQSEPHVSTLRPRAGQGSGDVRSWGSRRGSASSTDCWSEDTMDSSEDGPGTFGSDDDLLTTKETPPATASTTTTPATAIITISSDIDPSVVSNSTIGSDGTTTVAQDMAEASSMETTPEKFVQRPKSHSVVAATFLSRPQLSGDDSTYSDILNKNVRLWKDRLEHAHNLRQRVAILEEHAQES